MVLHSAAGVVDGWHEDVGASEAGVVGGDRRDVCGAVCFAIDGLPGTAI